MSRRCEHNVVLYAMEMLKTLTGFCAYCHARVPADFTKEFVPLFAGIRRRTAKGGTDGE